MRSLSAPEEELIRKLIAMLPEDCRDPLEKQIAMTVVVEDHGTWLDLSGGRPGDMPDTCSNGPLPVRGRVGPADDPTGYVVMWVSDGAIEGVEYSWFDDEYPGTLPAPDSVTPVLVDWAE